MLLSSLLLIPIIGVFAILINKDNGLSAKNVKFIALTCSVLNLAVSLIIFILFDFSTNQFQFVQEYHEISYFDFYLGVDGLSIYFILLTTIIIPVSLLSNWKSISKDIESYVIIILLLETLLLAVFLVLDILLFYIFFESILPPLFILIGIFGSDNRVKASFYLFLYTLLGSLFLLLSILAMSSIMSTTDFDTLFKGNFLYITQLFLFYGIFIAFAVKTPTIFLNTWLLKAHVESPLGGSIILAAIVLKLSLYGILRLILPILPKAYMEYTYIIYLIGVITVIYASLSTLRTIDVKELIAYSSVSHAAVYLLGVFSNNIQGIEGSINLGLAHGFVSPGLFICAGGILYDRSSTRLITNYKGVAQIMPLFAILFFILCLGNCGAPLTLNFIGEFMALYGTFERSSLFGVLASTSIIFSAAYTIYMFQRISFGGVYSRMFTTAIPDLTKREFMVLLTLVVPTVIFGIYTAPILDALHYSVSTLIYSFDLNIISCDAPTTWGLYFQDSANPQMEAHIWALFVGINYRILKDKCSPYLDLTLHNPPKPYAFISLPLQSAGPGSSSDNPNNTPNTDEFLPTSRFLMHDGQNTMVMDPAITARLEELKALATLYPLGTEQRALAVKKVNAIIDTELHFEQMRKPSNMTFTGEHEPFYEARITKLNEAISQYKNNPSLLGSGGSGGSVPTNNMFLPIIGLPSLNLFNFVLRGLGFLLPFAAIICLYAIDLIPDNIKLYIDIMYLSTAILFLQIFNLIRRFYMHSITLKNLIEQNKYGDLIIIFYIFILFILIFTLGISDSNIMCDAPKVWELYLR